MKELGNIFTRSLEIGIKQWTSQCGLDSLQRIAGALKHVGKFSQFFPPGLSVVVPFYPWFNFHFPFVHLFSYINTEKEKWKIRIELQHINYYQLSHFCLPCCCLFDIIVILFVLPKTVSVCTEHKIIHVLAWIKSVFSKLMPMIFSLFQVEFVMAYMAGNLTRRFRSGRARSSVCVSSQGAPCITEVVTSNFQQIVLDETKVGSL